MAEGGGRRAESGERRAEKKTSVLAEKLQPPVGDDALGVPLQYN